MPSLRRREGDAGWVPVIGTRFNSDSRNISKSRMESVTYAGSRERALAAPQHVRAPSKALRVASSDGRSMGTRREILRARIARASHGNAVHSGRSRYFLCCDVLLEISSFCLWWTRSCSSSGYEDREVHWTFDFEARSGWGCTRSSRFFLPLASPRGLSMQFRVGYMSIRVGFKVDGRSGLR